MEPEKLSTKSILLWAGVAILITVVVIVAVKFASPPQDVSSGVVVGLEPISSEDWVFGTGAIELIEYSDFECPACASYHPLVERILEEYEDSLKFTYRHFPLTYHLQAKSSAYAAEAAGNQGKFWEMSGLLFTRQSEWAGNSGAKEIFESYAQELSLDMSQYRLDVESSVIRTKVNNHYRSGIEAKVNATPTFYLNGKKMNNPSSYESFKALVEAEILARQGESSEQTEN